MLKHFFYFFIFSILVSKSEGATPWANSKERRAPWYNKVSKDRAEKRQKFFKDLGEAPAVASSRFQQKAAAELSDLPWGEYEREYQALFNKDLLWPVKNAKISSGFGIRHGRPHEGLDLKAEMGAEIRSIADGKVVFEGRMPGYGLILVIAHGNSYTSIYAHNQSHSVKRGQLVKQGQVIGRLGNSGKVSGAHLHFEIRVQGKPINPLKFQFKERWVESSSL